MRRPVHPGRRQADGGSAPFAGSSHQKSRPSKLVPVALLILCGFLLFGYFHSRSGRSAIGKIALQGEGSCTNEVQQAIPFLKKAYGDSFDRILHVGPDTCSVVSKLLKEEKIEAWGIEPYDLEDADSYCKSLVHKGIVRVADIKFPLPYKPKSFSLVVVSDALDYLSTKYLNKTLPDLARVSKDGLVVFSGNPGQHKAKVSDTYKVGRSAKLRSASWWIRYFVQSMLEENDDAIKKFEEAASKAYYSPSCQIFHLRSYN